MPSWLRDLPARAPTISASTETVEDLAPAPAAATPLPEPARSLPPALPPLGAQADPRTFLTEDDFPRWLHLLAAQQAARKPSVPTPVPILDEPVPAAAAVSMATGVDWPRHVAPALPEAGILPSVEVAASPPPINETLPEAAMPPPDQSRRVHSSWETLLLIALFIGLVVAAVWALVVNGVFSPAATP